MRPEPCPELSAPEAVERLGRTPGFLRDAAVRLRGGWQRWKPGPDEFWLLEHVCHLRDLEREGYGARVRRILLEDRPRLPDFDGARAARERDYLAESLPEALESFAAARAHNLAIVSSLRPARLGRAGLLGPCGEVITLGGLLARMCAHDEEHREQIAGLLRRLPPVRQPPD